MAKGKLRCWSKKWHTLCTFILKSGTGTPLSMKAARAPGLGKWICGLGLWGLLAALCWLCLWRWKQWQHQLNIRVTLHHLLRRRRLLKQVPSVTPKQELSNEGCPMLQRQNLPLPTHMVHPLDTALYSLDFWIQVLLGVLISSSPSCSISHCSSKSDLYDIPMEFMTQVAFQGPCATAGRGQVHM